MKSIRTALFVVAWVTGTVLPGAAAGVDSKTDTKPAVHANNAFAIDLYQQLCRENKNQNVVFSPYSVLTALTMTAEGARKRTAEEMNRNSSGVRLKNIVKHGSGSNTNVQRKTKTRSQHVSTVN